MGGVAPRITIDAGEFENLLTSIAKNIDLSKNGLGKKIANILRADARMQFQAGGVPSWAPLSPRTIERKRRLGYPRLNRRGLVPRAMLQRGNFGPENILMMTGSLFSSWTNENDPHHVEEINPSSVATGSDLIYAGTMQEGGEGWNGAPIPARPIIITEQARARIAELIEDQATQQGT